MVHPLLGGDGLYPVLEDLAGLRPISETLYVKKVDEEFFSED
jgi:hypothetical protein